MPKKIVFCADGTWNGPEDQTGVSPLDGTDSAGELSDAAVTNVVRLFSSLSGQVTPETMTLHNEQEKTLTDPAGATTQLAKYVHGVAESKVKISY